MLTRTVAFDLISSPTSRSHSSPAFGDCAQMIGDGVKLLGLRRHIDTRNRQPRDLRDQLALGDLERVVRIGRGVEEFEAGGHDTSPAVT